MRLINADALGIGKAKREAFTVPEYADGWNNVIAIIDKAPTIVALPTRSQFKRMAVYLGYEPVVHCKECKHLMFSDCYGECGAARMGIVSPDVQKLKASLNNVAESVNLGNLNIREIREAIKDEHGWEIV